MKNDLTFNMFMCFEPIPPVINQSSSTISQYVGGTSREAIKMHNLVDKQGNDHWKGDLASTLLGYCSHLETIVPSKPTEFVSVLSRE
jgi:hypothetical protein